MKENYVTGLTIFPRVAFWHFPRENTLFPPVRVLAVFRVTVYVFENSHNESFSFELVCRQQWDFFTRNIITMTLKVCVKHVTRSRVKLRNIFSKFDKWSNFEYGILCMYVSFLPITCWIILQPLFVMCCKKSLLIFMLVNMTRPLDYTRQAALNVNCC